MDPMSIAMTSVNMHQMEAAQQMDVAVMKMAMEAETSAMEDMLELVDVSSMTGVGGIIDMLA